MADEESRYCGALCNACTQEGGHGKCSQDFGHLGDHKCNRAGHTW